MDTYSYSKIKLFGDCPHSYKLRYIDKIRVEKPQTVEQFTGNMVHKALEYLHEKIMGEKVPSLTQVLVKLEMQWNKRFDGNKLMINYQKNYKQLAFTAVENYYNANSPFANDKTIAVEKRVDKKFDNFNLMGYVDRIEEFPEKFVIHDYKSGQKKYFDEDQLKMYHLLLGPEKNAELVWHFVFLDEKEEIKSDLTGFENQISEKINKIESEKEFEKRKTGRCNWCIFKEMCIT